MLASYFLVYKIGVMYIRLRIYKQRKMKEICIVYMLGGISANDSVIWGKA